MTKPQPARPAAPSEVRTLNRLSATAYAALEKETLGRLALVPRNDGESYFANGVEFVLRKLRDGYVIGEQ